MESISKLRTASLESLGPNFETNCSDAESSSWLCPCKDRDVTRVLVSDVNDVVNAQNPSLVDEQLIDTRISTEVKVEQNEDEINERFDLALFLRKQKSSTHGKRRIRKFRPPTLSTEMSLSLLRKKLNIPDEIELAVPEPHERADDPPEGDKPSTDGSEQLEDSLGIAQNCSGDIQSEMERPRSFGNLAPWTTGSGKPPTPTSATTSAAPATVPAPAAPTTAPVSAKPTTAPASAKPTTAPASAKLTTAPASELCTTSSAKKTTTTAKRSRLPSATMTDLVAALPALLPSDYDAKRVAKGKGHEGDDRKRSSDRDDVIDVDRKSKRAQTRSASPPRRVSRSVFQDKSSASSLFSTLVLSDDVVAPIDTKSSGEMMRHGLKVYCNIPDPGVELF
ncbi:hypothetical protein AALP_AA8G144600 [Arabis alpina]|uniref:Uncharacterized protein n=1 Tax=Arabis alpina TaxID=50452 RepID=A0A087G721_ARAAL|nr:hypothetical protein AALP_AA8G144600 [Arabis alpina]